ncbi:hypothetical protein HAX54_029163 [Datura stramonium]|uniref:Uncharacterized protein n=1 Tax=Datura stramonium TaxID=4076 RepID=A0ABS8SA80_DATST|nr:hypothetical protein [Datura stramonium]
MSLRVLYSGSPDALTDTLPPSHSTMEEVRFESSMGPKEKGVKEPDELSEDDQPLSWKVYKLTSKSLPTQLGDLIKPPSTRANSKKDREEVLKENQAKTSIIPYFELIQNSSQLYVSFPWFIKRLESPPNFKNLLGNICFLQMLDLLVC